MRPRLLLTRRLPEAVEAHLGAQYDLVLNEEDRPLSRAELVDALRRFDAICPTICDRFDAALLSASGRRARILANYGAGVEHIDLDAAARSGIVVTNTPDVLTDATADLAILLMLMAGRRAGEGERELRAGRWTGWRPTHMQGQGLQGRTLGLVGFGRIAQATASRARNGFDLRILYHARRRADPKTERALEAEFCASLDELAERSDIISLHCPGGAATRHLVNRDLIRRMKRDAILVNTARGSVVDEAALAEALAEERIAAAGLDVFEEEPRVNPALLALENAVLLPHLGSATRDARIAMGMRAATNLEQYFRGEAPQDRVA